MRMVVITGKKLSPPIQVLPMATKHIREQRTLIFYGLMYNKNEKLRRLSAPLLKGNAAWGASGASMIQPPAMEHD